MATDTDGKFVQFPLCLLSIPSPLREVMDLGIAYGVQAFINSLDDDTHDDDEAKLEHARRAVGFSGGSVRGFYQLSFGACKIRDEFEKAHHKTAIVRLPTPYAYEIREGVWSENESRVYLAIASAIGQKLYAKLGWEYIALRASGRLKPTNDTPAIMTRAQVDYAAGNLQARRLLDCYTYNRGVRYWSYPNKCPREQTARHVLTAKLKRKMKLRETCEAMTARLTKELLEGAK